MFIHFLINQSALGRVLGSRDKEKEGSGLSGSDR